MKNRLVRKITSLALCLTLTLSLFGGLSPAYATGVRSTAYAFGDVGGAYRDLAAEHREEAKRREAERKKAERKQAVREKAAMKKAAREARERKMKKKTAKESAEKGNVHETR